MASLTGPVYVPAPNPLVPRYGLVKVATGPLDLPVHGRIGGLQYETGVCDFPLCYEVECQEGHNTKTLTNSPNTIIGNPFIVYSSLLCAPVGLTDERVRQFLYEQLAAGEQGVVEDTFSRGACGQSPSLANNTPNATALTASANVVLAVTKLEAWLYARYGLPGVLHVPYTMAAYMSFHHLVEYDSRGILRTDAGTAVVFGNYAGLGVAGAAPAAGSTNIYITGQVALYRTGDGDLFVTTMADTLNRTTNQVTAVMEREYVLTYDCFAAATETVITGVVV